MQLQLWRGALGRLTVRSKTSSPLWAFVAGVLCFGASAPVAIRVEVEPLAASGAGTEVAVIIQISPEDRTRVGANVMVRIALDGEVPPGQSPLWAVRVKSDGGARVTTVWPPGEHHLKVEISSPSGKETGLWVGTVRIPSFGDNGGVTEKPAVSTPVPEPEPEPEPDSAPVAAAAPPPSEPEPVPEHRAVETATVAGAVIAASVPEPEPEPEPEKPAVETAVVTGAVIAASEPEPVPESEPEKPPAETATVAAAGVAIAASAAPPPSVPEPEPEPEPEKPPADTATVAAAGVAIAASAAPSEPEPEPVPVPGKPAVETAVVTGAVIAASEPVPVPEPEPEKPPAETAKVAAAGVAIAASAPPPEPEPEPEPAPETEVEIIIVEETTPPPIVEPLRSTEPVAVAEPMRTETATAAAAAKAVPVPLPGDVAAAYDAWADTDPGTTDLTVIVSRGREPVPDLTPGALRLRIAKAEVPIAGIGDAGNSPLYLGVAVDLSPAEVPRWPAIGRGLEPLVERVGGGRGRFFVATDGNETDWAADPAEISEALESPTGGDLATLVVASLAHFEGQRGRTFLILLTDGHFETSKSTWSDATAAVDRAGVPILVLALWNDEFPQRARKNLQQIAAASGGRLFLVQGTDQLGGAVERYGRIIDAGVALRFQMPAGMKSPSPISVDANDRSIKVTAPKKIR